MTYPFSGVSIALAGDCKGDVLIHVSVSQGLISEASWVHLSFIPDMVLMCLFKQLNFGVVRSSVFIVFSSFFGGRTKVR